MTKRVYPKIRRLVRWVVGVAVATVVLAGVGTVGCVQWLRFEAHGHLFDAKDVPPAPVALVLGAQADPDGSPSPFLAARLDIARELFGTGKVRAILVSGDNSRPDYDEPTTMLNYLVAHGVPKAKVVRDYAGFDTYDSCARAVRIFGVRRAIVVTQEYHIARAVALCREVGLEADGVGDTSMRQFHWPWIKGALREYGAADKAAYDSISGRDPVYLGKHETGVDDALAA